MNEKFGKYIVLDDPQAGGQSEVLKVRHKEYGYIRALSVTDLKNGDNTQRKKFKERCGRLLRLCNGNHPNIVHCYPPEIVGNQAFFEMDYINGDNLYSYLEKNSYFLPIEEVVNMIVQMSDALSFCHYGTYEFSMNPDIDKDPDTGEPLVQADINDGKKLIPVNEDALKKLVENHQVIHNDISSKNIMRSCNGTFVLIDFGLSVEGNEFVAPDSIRRKEGHREYMAPERWDGAKPTTQSDIYSFGIVMYEYLTGHVPFKLETDPYPDYDLLKKAHRDGRVPNIIEKRKESFKRKFPDEVYVKEEELDWLEEIILQCLRKNTEGPECRIENGETLRIEILKHLNKDSAVYKDEELKRLQRTNEKQDEEVRELRKENELLRKQLDEASKFKVCKKCGVPSFVDDSFCRHCGTKFDIQ